MISRLQYRSSPLRCGLPEMTVRHSDVLMGWKIEEEWAPTEEIAQDVALVDYQILLSREISRYQNRNEQEEELFRFQEQAFLLIYQLKLLWPLIFGSLQSTPRTISPSKAPESWTTNSSEVLDFFHPSTGSVYATISERNWIILPFMPLEKVIIAHKAYESASIPLRTLVELYHAALQLDGQAAIFTLAKSLELIRAILPGRTDKAKMKHLPPEDLSVMTQDLSWLFMIANNRYETRHFVRDLEGPHLHPQLTAHEKKEFLKNATRLIRATICQAFEIPFLYSDTPTYVITDSRSL